MRRLLTLATLMLCVQYSASAEEAAGSHSLTLHLFYSPTCAHCHEVRSLVKGLADGALSLSKTPSAH